MLQSKVEPVTRYVPSTMGSHTENGGSRLRKRGTKSALVSVPYIYIYWYLVTKIVEYDSINLYEFMELTWYLPHTYTKVLVPVEYHKGPGTRAKESLVPPCGMTLPFKYTHARRYWYRYLVWMVRYPRNRYEEIIDKHCTL
jgi:hypothetical protein